MYELSVSTFCSLHAAPPAADPPPPAWSPAPLWKYLPNVLCPWPLPSAVHCYPACWNSRTMNSFSSEWKNLIIKPKWIEKDDPLGIVSQRIVKIFSQYSVESKLYIRKLLYRHCYTNKPKMVNAPEGLNQVILRKVQGFLTNKVAKTFASTHSKLPFINANNFH